MTAPFGTLLFPACSITRAVSAMHRGGRMRRQNYQFRDFIAMIIANIAVDVGLVEGLWPPPRRAACNLYNAAKIIDNADRFNGRKCRQMSSAAKRFFCLSSHGQNLFPRSQTPRRPASATLSAIACRWRRYALVEPRKRQKCFVSIDRHDSCCEIRSLSAI